MDAPSEDLNLRARFPNASATYIEFAEKFFRESELGTFTEPQFWKLIDEARSVRSDSNAEDENDSLHRQALTTSLSALDKPQLYDAAEIYWRHYFELYNREIWSAIGIVWGHCSDDSFMDFREWLLSQGESASRSIIDAPDGLPSLIINSGSACPFFQGAICGPIWQIFEDRTGGYEIPLLDQSVPNLTGVWIEEENVAKLLPKCFRHKHERSSGSNRT